jgi:hypothetical protein
MQNRDPLEHQSLRVKEESKITIQSADGRQQLIDLDAVLSANWDVAWQRVKRIAVYCAIVIQVCGFCTLGGYALAKGHTLAGSSGIVIAGGILTSSLVTLRRK